jgi:hypothetical protein
VFINHGQGQYGLGLLHCNMIERSLQSACQPSEPEHYENVTQRGGGLCHDAPTSRMGRDIQGDSIVMSQAKIREGSTLAVVVDEEHNQIVFNVRGAAPDGGGKSVTLSLAKVHQSNVNYAALHGFKQRIGDMAALSRNPDTGQAASPADKFDAIVRGVEHYESGAAEWNLRGAVGERTSGEIGLLSRAIAEVKGTDAIKVRDWLKTKSRAEQVAIALSAEVKPVMDRMRREAAGDVDAEGLLAELG